MAGCHAPEEPRASKWVTGERKHVPIPLPTFSYKEQRSCECIGGGILKTKAKMTQRPWAYLLLHHTWPPLFRQTGLRQTRSLPGERPPSLSPNVPSTGGLSTYVHQENREVGGGREAPFICFWLRAASEAKRGPPLTSGECHLGLTLLVWDCGLCELFLGPT